MSRFLQQSLMPGERIVLTGKFHYIYTVKSFLIFALFTAGGAVIHALIERAGILPQAESVAGLASSPSMWPAYMGATLGALVFLSRAIVKASTIIVLTDKRFLFKRGVFTVRSEKMAMREVNYCEVRQSFMGNLLDYGRVYVYTLTLDDNNILLPEIARPHVFASMIERIKKGDTGGQPHQQQMPHDLQQQKQASSE